MFWINKAYELSQSNQAFVLVTLVSVVGHSPRHAGSKMLVTESECFGSVGGGNLEKTAVEKAKKMLAENTSVPEMLELVLSPNEGEFGIQCCGGKVEVVLEPTHPIRPSIAIFGAGHVGKALSHILATLPINLYLIDSRESQLQSKLVQGKPVSNLASLYHEHKPIPESILPDLPNDAAILIMTHDHAEDIAILEQALRYDSWSYIGLIGSESKWRHFKKQLEALGLSDKDFDRVTTPIGIEAIQGKSPQTIAISVAAELLSVLKLSDSLF